MQEQDPVAQAQALSTAKLIKETMETPGWSWIRSILSDNINAMNDINDVKSLKELQAKQMASKTLKSFLADLDGIVQASDRVLGTSSFTDERYRIFKLHDK